MENKFSKFINLQGKYLTSLLILLALSIGYAWADTGVSAGTYELSSTYKPGNNKRFKSIGTGIYLHRVNNSSWNGDYGMKLKDNQNGVAFYISSGMNVSFRYYKNSNSKAETTTFSVYTISSSDYALFTGGTENSTNVELTLGTASATKTVELDASYKDYKVTDAIALTAGYYYIVGKDDTSNGTTYWTSLTLTSACSTSITTQPSGATLAVGDANPTLSIVATNAASYAWKESSDGTSYDGGSSLASTASFTPEVNDAVQTKYYYCEVTSDCDGTTVVKSNIVTVNVVGAITYYTVTLVPAGGTISDATGWTLNAGNYEKEVAEGTELTLPTFTKENRNFKTWRKAGPADVASPVTVNSDLALTAVWTATIENVIYSWEGAEGGATEVGGTAAGNVDNLINQPSAGYYCLKIDGNNSYSANLVEITLAGEEKVKTGDKIVYWGFYNKSSSANARPKMRDGNTPNAQIFDDGTNLPNLYSGGDPAKREFTVPADINTNKVQITRSQTGSNTWIPKLQIIREVQVEEGDLLKVTLNYNDGSTPNGEILVASGSAATKPADPTWAHHRFNEWQLSGSAYNWATIVSSNITLVADWTQLYTISFANGGGSGDAPAAIADKAEGETFEVPANTFTAPSASQEFDKWNDGTSDFAPGDTYTVGTANVVLTAQWKALVAKYTVIFKDGETTLDTRLVDVGSNPSDAGIDKTKPLFAFAAWQLSGSDIALDDASWTSVAANAEVTLTARWAKAYATDIDFEAFIDAQGTSGDWAAEFSAKNYAISSTTNVTLDAPSGKPADKGLKIKNSGAYISFNVNAGKLVILKAGVLSGAEISVDGGANYTALTGATGSTAASVTSYHYNAAEAEYRIRTTTGSYNIIQAITIQNPFEVSFDENGGDAAIAAMHGTPSVTLPTPTKGSDSFLGWFDAATGGNKIGDAGISFTPSKDTLLYAQWEAVSTDARLASITFSSAAGTLSPAFDPEVVNYTYTMPYPTAEVPTITGATAVNANAQTPVIDAQAANWGDVAQIHGVAQSGDTKNYYITIQLAPKDGVSIITATLSGESGKAATCTVTGLIGGTAAVNLSNMKSDGGAKLDNGKSFGITLAEGAFQAGDVVNVNITTAAGQGTFAVWADNACSELIVDAGVVGVAGSNKVVLPAAVAGKSTIYLARTDAVNNWNPQLNVFEVLRAMNPVLAAMTIDGRTVTIDEEHKTATCTIPYEAVLSSLTVVPTIVRNAPHATTPEAVISNEGAWIEGDNTYRVMDKDGDYTDYTITLSRDVQKHTVSFNTHGGSAVASEEVEHNGYLAADQVPADPEKDDYIFQGWSLSDGGAIIADIKTVQIDDAKEFHAVWAAETGVVKLIDALGAINTTDFITGVTASTVNFDDADHNCAVFGDANVTDITNCQYLAAMVQYNARTNKTKVKLDFYSVSGGKKAYLFKMVEGGDVETIEIDMPTAGRYTTEYYTFDSESNRSIYVTVSDRSKVNLLQMKVIDNGETTLKRFGEAGYSLNLNKSRLMARTDATVNFEGMTVTPAAHNRVNYSTYLSLKSDRDPVSFTIAAPVTMTVVNGSSNKYYVSTSSTGSGDEFGADSNEFDLTAGTWYIVPKNTSAVQLTSIAFSAPKCEKPAFSALADVDLCEGDAFTAINGAATVSDGGTISYHWYNEDDSKISGATAATFTPSADGKYYVIATNSLAGFADNFAKSDLVTVQHVASAVITEAPKSVRKDAGQEATLTVAASGKNLSYEWFTCDNEAGANPVAIVPAETNASLTVTVPSGTQWYKVVVSSDCGNAEAIAKVEEWVELSQVDVTATTEWDWVNAGDNIKLDDTSTPKKNEEGLMANIRKGDAVVTNDATFNSQALLFYGENVRNIESGRAYASVGHISFNTTVPGAVFVEFSDNGSNNRRLSINGKLSEPSATKTDVKTFMATVPAGEVVLMGVNEDGTGENKYLRISKISFVKTDYTREVNSGRYGTICLPNGGKMYGAALYEVAYLDAPAKKIYFDEVLNGAMVAGTPYIFLPNAGIDLIAVAYTDEADAPAGNMNGLYGSYTQELLAKDAGNYILLNNQYLEVNSDEVYVGANRAYLKIGVSGGVPTTAIAPAPGRRRISMGIAGREVPTALDNLNAGEQPMKVIIDGQLFILRGEQMFDATGRLVK